MAVELVPKIIYHYCTLEAFCQIITRKELRLADVRKTNDSAEQNWIFYIFKEYWDVMKRNLKQLSEENQAGEAEQPNHTQYLAALEELKRRSQSQDEKVLFDSIFHMLQKNYVGCAACFSTKADLLSQWRGYADDGAGIAIGFRSAMFRDFVEEASKSGHLVSFGKVVYELSRQMDYSQTIMTKILEEVAQLPDQTEDALSPQLHGILDLWGESLFFKHASFKEEREWRFIVNDHRLNTELSQTDIYGRGCRVKPRKFYVRNADLVSYRNFGFESAKKPILKITIGPKCQASVSDVQMLLQDNGLKGVTVKKSEATYQ